MTITDGKKRVKSNTKLKFFNNFSIVINEICVATRAKN